MWRCEQASFQSLAIGRLPVTQDRLGQGTRRTLSFGSSDMDDIELIQIFGLIMEISIQEAIGISINEIISLCFTS